MVDSVPFSFISDAGEATSPDRLVVRVPTGLASKEALLDELYQSLELPGYFGGNWDALSDCLRDLHWVRQREVVIIHQDIPALRAHEVREYLMVLSDAVKDWDDTEDHQLHIHFSTELKDRVIASVTK